MIGLTVAPIALPSVESQAASHMLVDSHGRRIRHLRLSITSACDLRCVYCRPRVDRHCGRTLTDAQRVEMVRFLHRAYGLSQVRITGGEPLLWPGAVELVAALREAAPSLSLAMTTNGQRLAPLARALRQAGLDRLNISIDSQNEAVYRRLTGGALGAVLDGIEAALAAGFPPPKLNAVVLRGHNDRDMGSMVLWAFARGCEMRFLEAMPIGPAAETNRDLFVSADEIEQSLRESFTLRPLPPEEGGTSQRFMVQGAGGCGIVGLIAPMTRPFCGGCGRVRLTADGKFYPCLLDERHVELNGVWADGVFDRLRADELIRQVVREKKAQGSRRQSAAMVLLGG